MTVRRLAVDEAQEHLTPAAEAEWNRFRRHLELADGFWLTFMFSSSPASVHIFENRTERVLRARANKQAVVAPASPAELIAVVPRVFALRDLDAIGCIWVEAVFADGPGETNGLWSDAWTRALLAFNQGRQRLREQLPAGLVIAAPSYLKPSVRVAAPDLWSIRTLVIELAPTPATQPTHGPDLTRDLKNAEEPTSMAKPKPALGPLDGNEEDRDSTPPQELIERLRHMERLISSSNMTEALEVGHEVVSEARAGDRPLPLAQALIAVAEAESASGDLAATAHHLAEAIPLLRASSGGERLLLATLSWAAQLTLADGDASQACTLLEEKIALLKRHLADLGEIGEVLRDLMTTVGLLGNAHIAGGHIAAAATAYREATDLAQRILDTYGETPQALRDLSVSLDKVGNTQIANGDITAATTTYQQSLDLRRRILDTYGETPEALRDFSVSLDKVGNTQIANGDITAATTTYQQSLDLTQRILDTYGETPEALRDVSVSLDKVGDTQIANGDITAATTTYQQSLDFAQRILDTYGETPQALRDLSISLNKVGNTQIANGDITAATTTYQQSLDLDRHILDTYGETPQALRDVSVSLDKVGDTQIANGDIAAATTTYQQSLDLRRRILDTYGETPQALHDLNISLNKLATALDASGDKQRGNALREEARAVAG